MAVAGTATANPVPVGGVYQSTPAILTNGQTAELQFTPAQNAKVDLSTISGTAPTTAGKVDVKGADGDVFVRQTTASNLNATVVGNLTNNNAAPSTNNFGVLASIANTSAPVLTEGKLGALSTDLKGHLRTRSYAETILGDLVVDHRLNQIEINFSSAFDAGLITNSVTNSGTATQANGKATYSTSTNANGTAKGVSVQTINYRAGTEIYAYFTAAFTTPTSAASFQRIGVYGTNDGLFIGYEGTTFGVTRRQNTSDTQTAQASFNGDPLNGTASSAFTRDGTPEAVDWTKLNIFRIRFSWFGAAPMRFEIYSPDGLWITMHTIKYPNTSTAVSIFDPSQPMTVHVSKTGSDATNLSLITACWAGGCTDASVKITDAVTDYSLAPLFRSVIAGHTTAGGGSYVNVKVNPSGTLATAPPISATGSETNVAASASNVTLLAANASRLGAAIYNDSTEKLYVKLGATASATSFTVLMSPNTYYEVPFSYTGIIEGLWSSASGAARITEMT